MTNNNAKFHVLFLDFCMKEIESYDEKEKEKKRKKMFIPVLRVPH